MSENKTYLTVEGAQKLKEELAYLRNVKRPELSARLNFAIKQGDLSENADYIQSKEEMGFLEGRIQALERMLQNVEILVEGGAPGEARLGSKVTVQEEGFPDREVFMIVGVAEADPRKGRVSNESPMGKALLGRRAGDKVHVNAPGGATIFKVLKVE
ncbi:MAG: transcription elongation factor GreA [Thermoflexales bacterium]|nr:transcription elongation factor GreA [Thermoflexales bacterium]